MQKAGKVQIRPGWKITICGLGGMSEYALNLESASSRVRLLPSTRTAATKTMPHKSLVFQGTEEGEEKAGEERGRGRGEDIWSARN